jgi:dTDP-4-dehydrorhamnose 3,5-epimerase
MRRLGLKESVAFFSRFHMDVQETNLPGVLLLKPNYFHDARGYFIETYSFRLAQALGIRSVFVQDNQSLSRQRGTVRALHFQIPPHAQAKLVRVLRGSIYDVAVDLRVSSPTYGRWVATTLTAKGGEQLFVPVGFAHGFCTLEPETEVAYKVDSYYDPKFECGLAWDDPTLAITWPVPASAAVLSDRDRAHQRFADFVSPFRCEEL